MKNYDRAKENYSFSIWDELGITEHLGSIHATNLLIKLCNITPNQYVLDVGCGSGYTACLLAKKYQVNVVALDINSRVLKWAKRRIIEEGISDRVTIIEVDAHSLPFPNNTFDSVIVESILIFCNQKKVLSEVHHVLKLSGVFDNNEATWLKCQSDQVHVLLSKSLGIHPLLKDEWQAIFREAGFINVFSAVYKTKFSEMLLSHLKVDGIRRYFSAIIKSVFDPIIKSAFFNKSMLKVMSEYSSYIGYGLYVCRKG